jgi:integrase
MTRKPLLKFVKEYRDRHGKVRRYVRIRGRKLVPLRGMPGSDEYMEAYRSAIESAPAVECGVERSKPGTVASVLMSYLQSSEFVGLAEETRRSRRRILERFGAENGDKRIAKIERRHVVALVAAKAKTPAAARNFLHAVRALLDYSVAIEIRDDNPARGVRAPRFKSTGFQTWSEEHIAAFEVKFPIGTRGRLALALLLYTGQRRSDIVRMGWQHMNGELAIRVRQQKRGADAPELTIPIHRELHRVLRATPRSDLTFLTTAAGKPFTPAGFTNWFRDRCIEAGLPKGLSAHGLRKATCRRLAEAGCSANVIASISGHASLSEIRKYTEAAERAKMARIGIEAISERRKRRRGTKVEQNSVSPKCLTKK